MVSTRSMVSLADNSLTELSAYHHPSLPAEHGFPAGYSATLSSARPDPASLVLSTGTLLTELAHRDLRCDWTAKDLLAIARSESRNDRNGRALDLHAYNSCAS